MAPIFAYLGEESSLNDDLGSIGNLSDNVARFGALQVYIEHRLHGESIPEALKDADLRGYFSSAQALPDYAEVLLHIKKKYPADSTPVMVFGGSYGGLRKPLDAAEELKIFLDSFFSVAAQYDRPPRYPVDPVCKGIDSAPEGSDVLDKIFSGIVA
ncbi:hypothetical protein H0E87_016565 [Populus deltoides]|uniref:Uncharacterized protein n=1 Tax=Populus deltoides TaxID=3696 RepID=A0A8T2Y9Z3_POPDE|nr:hypothetical protein H0E87_016565 [Populus deltoides]